MTTIAEQLRAAALGPTPMQQHPPGFCVRDWGLKDVAHRAVLNTLRHVDAEHGGMFAFYDAPEHECRMFLLFVAEAEESETA